MSNNLSYDVKDNPVFERKEVKGVYVSNGTVSKSKLMAELSVSFKVKENHIDIRYIANKPGRNEAEFFALIYNKPIRDEPNNSSAEENASTGKENSEEKQDEKENATVEG